jgi:hypothetical protein
MADREVKTGDPRTSREKPHKKKTVYARIAHGHYWSHGVKLSMEDCDELMKDHAIRLRAELDIAGKDNQDDD